MKPLLRTALAAMTVSCRVQALVGLAGLYALVAIAVFSCFQCGADRGGSIEAAEPVGLSAEERDQIQQVLAAWSARRAELLRDSEPADAPRAENGFSTHPDPRDRVAEADLFHKGVAWALRYEEQLQPADAELIRKAVALGSQRTAGLEGDSSLSTRKGKLARGYVSAVDGSTQPFGLIVPESYDPAKPIRLDVVLHGSSRPTGMSELRFIDRFEQTAVTGQPSSTSQAAATGQPASADYIELHPLGRVENCYRWAGETDVFEAIAAVCRNYNIDQERIVLRGMSMGASGTWHLGLKHPGVFVALGPYCGYVDTHRFSETPLPNFIKVGPLPTHQELGLHMLDSVDYAANAGIVPAIACMGEKDVFFQAHVIMGEAFQREGLEMVNLISPGTGHVIDPVTHAEQMRRIGEYAARGRNRAPAELRFITWTLKYNESHWLRLLGLGEHYARAEISAAVTADGRIEVAPPVNVTRFAVLPQVLGKPIASLHVGGSAVAFPAGAEKQETFTIVRRGDAWEYVPAGDAALRTGKRPGLQGPIDDAFAQPFLCVRGTGQPWNAAVQAWSEANLRRFAYEWHRYFRGELPMKDDADVTEADVKRCNLILFGDPGSNRFLAQALPQLPIRWTSDELQVAGDRYSAADHAPLLIYPNPLSGAEGRYLVVNSGHTFHETELASLNYLLFPRLADWAVVKVGPAQSGTEQLNTAQPDKPGPLDEQVLGAGYFDESWQFKPDANPN